MPSLGQTANANNQVGTEKGQCPPLPQTKAYLYTATVAWVITGWFLSVKWGCHKKTLTPLSQLRLVTMPSRPKGHTWPGLGLPTLLFTLGPTLTGRFPSSWSVSLPGWHPNKLKTTRTNFLGSLLQEFTSQRGCVSQLPVREPGGDRALLPSWGGFNSPLYTSADSFLFFFDYHQGFSV